MVDKKTKLPAFRSDRAERDFWSRHSVEEFCEGLEDLDVVIRPAQTEQVALRLRREDVATLRTLAKKRGVGHASLVRNIVERWLAQQRHKRAPARSARLSQTG